jgi:putative PEP-CTERM system TPR-repeat lipoprotein
MRHRCMQFRSLIIVACLGLAAVTASSCSRDVERAKREFVERGDRYMDDKNVEAAIIEYRNAIQQDPRFGEAYRKLSTAYASRGDLVEAQRASAQAAELLPDVEEVQLESGMLLLVSGRFADARAQAERILAKNDKSVPARILLGNATAGLKDTDTAIKEFEEAIRIDPQQAGIYTGLALLKASAGERDEAERIFKQAIATDPKAVTARLALAQFYWSADRVQDAEKTLRDAHQLQPNDARVNVTLAVFLQAMQRGKEAEPYLRAAAEADKDPRLKMLLADYYIAQNRTDEAVGLLEPITTDRQLGSVASTRLAGIAQMRGRSEDALKMIDRALEQQPNNARTLAAKSDLLRQQNQLDAAVQVADQAVTANPQSAEAQFAKGRVLRAKGNYDKAEVAFKEVLRLNPRAAAARVELARLRIRAGADDAVAVATDAANADPASVDAKLTLARALLQKRDVAKAEVALDELVRVAPNVAAVHTQLGLLRALKNDAAGARAAFSRALELDPMQLEAISGMTAVDMSSGRKQEALARVDALTGTAPKNVNALLVAAQAHAAASNFTRAEELARTAIDVDPSSLGAYSLLGRIYLAQKRLDQARAQFQKIADTQERPIGPLTVIGTIDLIQNKNADAQQTFERVMKLDPKAGVAANNLAWLYLENGGNVDMALTLALTAKAQLPNAAEVNDTLGWAYFKKDRLSEAIATLRRAVELDPKNAMTIYHLALAYEKNGDRREARETMTRYLQLDPASERSGDVRRRLQALGTT